MTSLSEILDKNIKDKIYIIQLLWRLTIFDLFIMYIAIKYLGWQGGCMAFCGLWLRNFITKVVIMTVYKEEK